MRSERRARPVAVLILWSCALAVSLAGLYLQLAGPDSVSAQWGFRGGQGVLAVVFATVGAVVTSRRAGNVVGRIFLLLGVTSAILYAAEEFARYGADGRADGFFLEIVSWLQDWMWIGPAVGVGFLMLLFPEEKL